MDGWIWGRGRPGVVGCVLALGNSQEPSLSYPWRVPGNSLELARSRRDARNARHTSPEFPQGQPCEVAATAPSGTPRRQLQDIRLEYNHFQTMRGHLHGQNFHTMTSTPKLFAIHTWSNQFAAAKLGMGGWMV